MMVEAASEDVIKCTVHRIGWLIGGALESYQIEKSCSFGLQVSVWRTCPDLDFKRTFMGCVAYQVRILGGRAIFKDLGKFAVHQVRLTIGEAISSP